MNRILTITIAAALSTAACTNKSSDIAPGPGAISVPFQGNTYVTSTAYCPPASDGISAPSKSLVSEARDIIDEQTGLITDWSHRSDRLSFFFKASKAGSFNLFVDAVLPSETRSATLEMSVGSISHEVDVVGSGRYYVGEFPVTGPGYVRVDIYGSSEPTGSQFARISNFLIDGDIFGEDTAYVPQQNVDDSYWYRRGPSVHMHFTLPSGDVEWFYNEVVVPQGADIPDTYYMLTGFGEGYMGIQTHTSSQNNVLFSVWSPYSTDNPGEIPEDYRVTTLRKGKDVTVQDFGGEGSGGQSFLAYEWKPGHTYRTLVHIKPEGDGNTVYTGYFGDENGEWHLVASFRRPHTDTWYTNAYSFLECFCPETSIWTREVHFRNQWAIMSDGTFKEMTKARFTCDNTGKTGMRADMYGALEDGDFVLRNCGFFAKTTEYGATFNRQSGGTAPAIDFEYLESL